MNGFNPIDLSKVPAPAVVEELDFEVILKELQADYLEKYPDYSAMLESDPIQKLLEVSTYREQLLRQRVNDAARANMLAYADGPDLDNLAAIVPVERNMIDPGDPEASPPVDPTYEENDEFRARVQMAPEAFSVAGPSGGYEFHALSVPQVKAAKAVSPEPGVSAVYVLGRSGSGLPEDEILASVSGVLNHEKIRPLTDTVRVLAADIQPYVIEALLYIQPGPAASSVLAAARAAVEKLVADKHIFGGAVSLSAIYAALHVEGVARVELLSPTTDIAMQKHQVPYCVAINISEGGNG
ncbi:baseplate assembly protein [Maridesulfovibrio sp.]|uniref:baseplate assembly protein n=1 Tax=Maridesulfovibrio sp. TaxID=2795000 RepID=UPI003B008A3E